MTPFRLKHLALAAVTLWTAAACGPSAPPVITSFTASPATLPLGGGRTTLAWKIDGDATVTLSPEAGELGADSVAVDLTATTKYVLTAANEKGSVSAELTVTVADSATIQGQVVSTLNEPYPGLTVVIGDSPAVQTDADGRFSISGVKPPYEVLLLGVEDDHVLIYQGLSSLTPRLAYFSSPDTSRNTTFNALYTGGVPNASNVRTRIVGRMNGQDATSGYVNDANAGSFWGWAYWNGDVVGDLSLLALQWTVDGNGVPTAYTGLAEVQTQLTDDVHKQFNVALQPVTSSPLTIEAELAAGFGDARTTVTFELGGVGPMLLVDHAPLGDTVTLPVPQVGAVSARVWSYNARGAAAMRQVAGVTGKVQLTMPNVPRVLSPIQDAIVDEHTVFSWTPFEGGTHVVSFWPEDHGPTFTVVTQGTSMKFPEYPRLGLAFPEGAPYYYDVEGIGPSASVEDAVPLLNAYWDDTGSFIYGAADEHWFSTAGANQQVVLTKTRREFPRLLK